jgi:hypothetical protein
MGEHRRREIGAAQRTQKRSWRQREGVRGDLFEAMR